jgi:guanylate kinase
MKFADAGRTAFPIIISAPSGAGKSTIAQRIAGSLPNAVLSVSCTTRPPRPAEENGRHYHFLTATDFQSRIDAGDFLEWAPVHGHYYGTPLRSLRDQLSKGNDVILTIDPQGAISIKPKYPEAVFIFVVPPTWEDLINRLCKRATDDPTTRDIRITNARAELSYLPHYDYLVVNDDLETAVSDVLAIIRSEHRRLSRVDKQSIPILTENIIK